MKRTRTVARYAESGSESGRDDPDVDSSNVQQPPTKKLNINRGRYSGNATRKTSLKRARSTASLDTDSSEVEDGNDADQDYVPEAATEKRQFKAAHRPKDTSRKRQRALKTPQPTETPDTSSDMAVERKRNIDFSTAISAKARLPFYDLGAVEMLTFFPLHMQWPEMGLRLHRNGWSAETIAKAMLHARNKLDPRSTKAVEKRRCANRHQVIKNGREFFKDEDFKPSNGKDVMTPVSTYDATGYAPRSTILGKSLFTAKLVDIANGVVHWPKGEDRGVVTQAIEYAVRNRHQHLTTVDIPAIADQQGFQKPADSFTAEWDQRGLERSEARIQVSGSYRPENGKWYADAFEPETEAENNETNEQERSTEFGSESEKEDIGGEET